MKSISDAATKRIKPARVESAVAKKNTADKRVVKKGSRVRDADATRANILTVAMEEFAEQGLSGSRIDVIAARSGSAKRMIYYYFGSKEGLFVAALQECYSRVREIEMGFDLDKLSPMKALRKLVEFTVDYQATHPEFIRMVMTENIHKGQHIRQIEKIRSVNKSVVGLLDQLCRRGIAEGVFRKDLNTIHLYMSLNALSFFNVSNQHTFGHIYSLDMTKAALLKMRREIITDMILRFVRPV